MCSLVSDERSISPVVGVALLVAIVVILSAGAAYFLLDLTQKQEAQPNVVLDVETDEAGVIHYFIHKGGEHLDGDKLRLRGAANPDALEGKQFRVDDNASFVAVESEITVVYTGEYGTSYTLGTFEAERTVSEPDEGCEWVDSVSNGGVDDVTVDGLVVNCDIKTDKVITVENGGVVIGDTRSDLNELDADDAKLYGDIDVEDVANVQNGTVSGSIESRSADVKVDETTVEGSIRAAKVVDVDAGSTIGGDLVSENKVVDVQDSTVSGSIESRSANVKVDETTVEGSIRAATVVEVTDGSDVAGDLESDNKTVKVLNSEVDGSLATDGDVKLDGATVGGDVYVDDSDFDCTDSTIDGQDCSEYTPRDPDAY